MVLTTNPYEQYRQQGVMTASPAELIVMLYDGCIRQLKLAILSLGDNNAEIANTALLKAQAIVQELSRSLDRQYDISHELARIYDFVEDTIYNVITSRSADDLRPLVEIMQELHGTWVQVSRETRATSLTLED